MNLQAFSRNEVGEEAAPFVVAITASFRRPRELERLLASLEAVPSGLGAVVVVDNAADSAVREFVEKSPLQTEYVAPGENLGCGGGLAAGERAAFEKFGETLTHLWILDDDAVVAPDALDALLAAMKEERADLAHALVTDENGNLGWFPGLLDPGKFRVIRSGAQTPDQFIRRCGADPIPFSWAQGIALLATRRAVEQLGFHRADYWVRGEDLEFSLRITHRFRGVYVPRARVQHLPPSAPAHALDDGEYRKHAAMLQNIAYTALRLPHGRRIARTIPGNWLRFLRTWRWKPRVVADAICMLWRGAVRASPAGVTSRTPSAFAALPK